MDAAFISMSDQNPSRKPGTRPGIFVTTQWSVVEAAGDASSSSSSEALEQLCRTYWYPVYAHLRRAGQSPHDAQDLTQAFFARLLARNGLKLADRDRGRFRTFLIVALKRFAANEWHRANTQKRGGGATHLSWDTSMAETRYGQSTEDLLSPDKAYDRQWALTLLREAMERLEEEYNLAGKKADFAKLKPSLTADRGELDYSALAKSMSSTPGAVRVAVHRIRTRYREIFRETIAATVADPQELEAELRHLLEALG